MLILNEMITILIKKKHKLMENEKKIHIICISLDKRYENYKHKIKA